MLLCRCETTLEPFVSQAARVSLHVRRWHMQVFGIGKAGKVCRELLCRLWANLNMSLQESSLCSCL
jgi:hypothetical protein